MQCFHRKIVIKDNKTEDIDNFSLCKFKGYRAEVFFKEVGSNSLSLWVSFLLQLFLKLGPLLCFYDFRSA